MEAAFDADFSEVRLHSDRRAERAAATINAAAFAVGNHVVFGAGQFRPDSRQGRWLLAHELAHIVQHDADAPLGDWTIGLAHDPAEAQADRMADIVATGGRIHAAPTQHAPAVRRADGGPDPLWENTVWRGTGSIGNVQISFKYAGYGNVHGAVYEVTVEGDVFGTFRANLLNDEMRGDYSLHSAVRKPDRGITKGAFHVRRQGNMLDISFAYDPFDTSGMYSSAGGGIIVIPPAPIEEPKVCGPDVAASLLDILQAIQKSFASWSDDDKTSACDTLIFPLTAAYAWDITQLHQHKWIKEFFQKFGCATSGPELCDITVAVHGQCHYAGSVNYVMSGVIWRLCDDYKNRPRRKVPPKLKQAAKAKPRRNTPSSRKGDEGWIIYDNRADALADGLPQPRNTSWDLNGLLRIIWMYKGNRWPVANASPNFEDSQQWARAGWFNWPIGALTPPPTAVWSACKTTCKEKTLPTWTAQWYYGMTAKMDIR